MTMKREGEKLKIQSLLLTFLGLANFVGKARGISIKKNKIQRKNGEEFQK